MTKRLVSIGECMVEMAAAGDGLFRQGFAGDTFNAAWHARRALPEDFTVSYFTAVGDEGFSARLLAFMQSQGIDTSHVPRLKGKAPGLYVIELNDGERSFTYWRDASAARHLADDRYALEAAVGEAQVVLFSGVTLAILPPAGRETLLAALAGAKAAGKLIAFDSNVRMRLWSDAGAARQAILAAARVATLALPTLSDETDLFGDKDAAAIAHRYRNAGVREIVVKAGPGPALVHWPDGETLIAPAQVVKPVDTTGAGDSFNGAYITARILGDDPATATHKAHARASRVIQSYGALV